MCECVCACGSMCGFVCVSVYMCLCACICICVCTSMHVCASVCDFVHVSVRVLLGASFHAPLLGGGDWVLGGGPSATPRASPFPPGSSGPTGSRLTPAIPPRPPDTLARIWTPLGGRGLNPRTSSTAPGRREPRAPRRGGMPSPRRGSIRRSQDAPHLHPASSSEPRGDGDKHAIGHGSRFDLLQTREIAPFQ